MSDDTSDEDDVAHYDSTTTTTSQLVIVQNAPTDGANIRWHREEGDEHG